MLLLIDNYDSFTHNLVHYLAELGAAVETRRNDAISASEALAMRPRHIVLSPGPFSPERAGACLEIIKMAADTATPLLGVCLGHQAIGQFFGGRIIRAPQPVHGIACRIIHKGDGVFAGIPSPFMATRYHSLIVEKDSLPEALEADALSEDGLAMGLRHKTLPIHGVQFHPESVASEWGRELLKNFLNLSGSRDL